LGKEINICHKKIKQKYREIDIINKDIETRDREKVILNNLSDGINEIQRNVKDFVSEKDVYLKHIADEQQQEFETAQKAVGRQCMYDFNDFYLHGQRRLEPIRKGNPQIWKQLSKGWTDFCQQARDEITTAFSENAQNSDGAYAAVVIAPPQQQTKRGA